MRGETEVGRVVTVIPHVLARGSPNWVGFCRAVVGVTYTKLGTEALCMALRGSEATKCPGRTPAKGARALLGKLDSPQQKADEKQMVKIWNGQEGLERKMV